MRSFLKVSAVRGFMAVGFLIAILIASAYELRADHHEGGHEVRQESIRSFDVTIDVLRSGQVEIEQDLVFNVVPGGRVKRGLVITYLTVFQGLGNLVLDQDLEIVEVERDGKPEPFRVEKGEGFLELVCGSEDVFLAPGPHRYRIKSTRIGAWRFSDGFAHWTYGINETFASFPIETLSFQLHLPEDVVLSEGEVMINDQGIARDQLEIEQRLGSYRLTTAAPIPSQTQLIFQGKWKSGTFATQSQWREVLMQHPLLPISAFVSVLLLLILVHLCVAITRRWKVRPSG